MCYWALRSIVNSGGAARTRRCPVIRHHAGKSSGTPGSLSGFDWATTVIFTDDPIDDSTPVKVVHFGEMQTAAFYPLHLILALFPSNHDGLLAPRL